MDEIKEAAFSARLGVIEMMLTLLLTEHIKAGPDIPEIAVERLRTLFWESGPRKPSAAHPDGSPQMQAFRREWERRVDILFDDAAKVLRDPPDK
jgi:hypothetical protein